MLACVFWHWPRPHIDAEAYEESLVRFHRGLAANPPPGFRRSLSVRVDVQDGIQRPLMCMASGA